MSSNTCLCFQNKCLNPLFYIKLNQYPAALHSKLTRDFDSANTYVCVCDFTDISKITQIATCLQDLGLSMYVGLKKKHFSKEAASKKVMEKNYVKYHDNLFFFLRF